MGGGRLDFTSSAFLGFRPRAVSLKRVITARPAALGISAAVRAAERALAGLTGFPRAWLAPSTLHLLMDLLLACRSRGLGLVLEREAYPLLAKPALALRSGAELRWFERGSPASLARALLPFPRGGAVVLAETLKADGPHLAPLEAYAEVSQRHGALLVLDDSQGAGLLGKRCRASPLGCGGQGSLAHVGIPKQRVVLIASLAKSFGVPAAFAASSPEIIEELFSRGLMALHASPASEHDATLVIDALLDNQLNGDVRRARLSERIATLRALCRDQGLPLVSSPLPLQRLAGLPGERAQDIWRRLRRLGIDTLLLRRAGTNRLVLAFVLRADHRRRDLERLVSALTHSVDRSSAAP